jgi:Protein of unknown function (DUF3551)
MRQPMRRQAMRHVIALAAGFVALSATSAYAGDWCSSTTHDNAVIECGYTTIAGCENAVGKGGMCFIDPDTAFNFKHAAPANVSKILGRDLRGDLGRG